MEIDSRRLYIKGITFIEICFLFQKKEVKDLLSPTIPGMGMEVFATLAGATIQGQIVGVYHAKRSRVCMQNNTNMSADNHTASLGDMTETLQNTVRLGVMFNSLRWPH